MKNLIFLILNILTIINLNAQIKLDGKIISAKTKLNPSEEIMIIVKETKEKTFTDSLGNFTLLNLNKNKHYSLELRSHIYGEINIEFETQSDNQIVKLLRS